MKNSSIDSQDVGVLELLLSETSKRFEHEENRKEILEGKLNFFMKFYGILISGILVLISVQIDNIKSSQFAGIPLIASIVLIFYLLIFLAYLYNIIRLQEYIEPVDPRSFYDKFSTEKISTLKMQLMSNYIFAFETNRESNNFKTKIIRRVRYHLWLQICIIVFIILLNIYTTTLG